MYLQEPLIASEVYQGTIHPQRGTATVRFGPRDFNNYFDEKSGVSAVFPRCAYMHE